ncbi:MAG: multidrug transporter MATE [Alphaproteobacteria bacterium]|nr:MAG: multidrug transporter MATE [Alphaproteobacteria bacterium]
MSGPAPRFLTGSTLGHVVRMTMAGMVGITFVFVVDVANLFWISLLGDERLVAALGFAFTVQFFSISVSIGMMIGATAIVARRLGARRRAEARHAAAAALVLSVAAQTLVASGVVLWRHELVALAGGQGETAALAARYLAISVASLPLMAASMTGAAVLRAEGDARRSMMVTLGSGAFSVVADPVLIYGLGLGLDGAALNVVVARAVALAIALNGAVRVHDLIARPRPADVVRYAGPFLAVALPALATQLSPPLGNAIVTRAVAAFGDGAVAGWSVVSRLTVLAFGGIFALSGAIGGILAQNWGAGRLDRVRRAFRDALLFAAAYALIAWALLAAAAGPVAGLFGLGEDGRALVLAFCRIAAGAFVFNGALFVANASFNALGRPLLATALNWTRDGVLMAPVVWAMTARFGAVGAVWGQALVAIAAGVAALALALRFLARLRPPPEAVAAGPAPLDRGAPAAAASASEVQ